MRTKEELKQELELMSHKYRKANIVYQDERTKRYPDNNLLKMMAAELFDIHEKINVIKKELELT
jgi:hypothetical protein